MPVVLCWLWKVRSWDAARVTGHTLCNCPESFLAAVWAEIAENLMQDFVTFFLLGTVPRRQGKGIAKEQQWGVCDLLDPLAAFGV